MAEMAERTWEAAGPLVVAALKEHDDYSLVITGHSLGAGVACLVNILCNQRFREKILGRNVKCFAYACPPIFNAIELVPDAVAGTTCYIHGNDGIPFLSLGNVRRMVSTLQWIDSQSLNPFQKSSFLDGMKAPNKDMINAALLGSPIRPKKGAPSLVIPASAVL